MPRMKVAGRLLYDDWAGEGEVELTEISEHRVMRCDILKDWIESLQAQYRLERLGLYELLDAGNQEVLKEAAPQKVMDDHPRPELYADRAEADAEAEAMPRQAKKRSRR